MTPPPAGSNLDFALAYHALGWWVFPGRDPLDLQEFRNSLIRQGKSHEAAYQETERARKHTFVAWAGRRKMGEAGRPTETEIRGHIFPELTAAWMFAQVGAQARDRRSFAATRAAARW